MMEYSVTIIYDKNVMTKYNYILLSQYYLVKRINHYSN